MHKAQLLWIFVKSCFVPPCRAAADVVAMWCRVQLALIDCCPVWRVTAVCRHVDDVWQCSRYNTWRRHLLDLLFMNLSRRYYKHLNKLSSHTEQSVSKDPLHHLSVKIFQMSVGDNFFIIVSKKIQVKALHCSHVWLCLYLWHIQDHEFHRPPPRPRPHCCRAPRAAADC